jgi:hypothetical protein
MTDKTLYIHIGTHKTGTTAIQLFLSANRDVLKTGGFLYPGATQACHELGLEIKERAFSEILADPASNLNRYLKEINQSPLEKIVLSSETFGHLTRDQISTMKKIIPARYTVKIIVYLRRQDERLESGYNQMVRQPENRLKTTISGLIEQGELDRVLFDYYAFLLPWRDVFGQENIIVRCYEKEQLPEGICSDFCTCIGISADTEYRITRGRVNESFHWDLIEWVRLCNIHCADDKNFQQFLVNRLKEINSAYAAGAQRHLLSPQQRNDIITRFGESNAKVAREYLNRPDGRLFYAPLPDPDEPWTVYEGLTAKKLAPLFFLFFYTMERRNRKEVKELRDELDELKKIQIESTGADQQGKKTDEFGSHESGKEEEK